MLRLKYLRLTRGVTQRELEKELGINHAMLSATESGRLTNPYSNMMEKLSGYFMCPESLLLQPVTEEEEQEAIAISEKMRRDAGRHGGLATSLKHGTKYMQKIGRVGNSVRNPGLENRRKKNYKSA